MLHQSILFILQYFQCTVLPMVDRLQTRAACRVAVLSLLCSLAAAQVNNAAGLGNVNQNLNPNPDAGVVFTGSGTNLLYGGERRRRNGDRHESIGANIEISYHLYLFQLIWFHLVVRMEIRRFIRDFWLLDRQLISICISPSMEDYTITLRSVFPFFTSTILEYATKSVVRVKPVHGRL